MRHGETAWNQERRIQGGGSDICLSEVGIKQAESLGLALNGTKITAIYSSPLRRALDTAQAIARYHQLMVHVEPDLREMEVGELEGVSIAELGVNFSQFLLQWRQAGGMEKLPGGESVVDLAERVWSTLQRIIEKHRSEAVVVVGHYFVVVVAICRVLGWPLKILERIRVQTGSISMIELGGRYPRLVSLGDTCHLKGT